MGPVLIVLRNPTFQKVVLGVLLVIADLIATELSTKKTR
jgi:hypothetical protein